MIETSVRPDSFWHPIRRRRFDSALVVLLALHQFPRLSKLQQDQAENELVKVFSKTQEYPYLAWREIVGPSSNEVAIIRGVAMARLNMPTGVDGLDWGDFVRPSWLKFPLQASYSFRSFDASTDQAIDFLRSKGLDLKEAAGRGLRWISEMHARYP
jgi:hypothetical protein